MSGIWSMGPVISTNPSTSRAVERKSAIRHLVRTFFDGSTEDAVLALLESADTTVKPGPSSTTSSSASTAARREGR